jgi:myo-inositol-1(or 4)-monophosphatase
MRRPCGSKGSPLPGSDLTAIRDALAAIVREAGAVAVTTAKSPFKQWMKAGSSPVSEADIAVNDFLLARLPALAPDAGWLSEETEDDFKRTATPRVWVVDPIDGTRAFLAQREDWSVSVALVEDARPMVAALYAPVTDEMFLAVRGAGATRNGVALAVLDNAGLADTRIAGPKSYLARLGEIAPGILPQPKIHSLALRLTRVADGGLDAAFASRNSHDWDLAAADLLVHEAGGTLTDLGGGAIRYNRRDTSHSALVAAAPARHAALIDLLRDRRNEFA